MSPSPRGAFGLASAGYLQIAVAPCLRCSDCGPSKAQHHHDTGKLARSRAEDLLGSGQLLTAASSIPAERVGLLQPGLPSAAVGTRFKAEVASRDPVHCHTAPS